MLEPRAFYKDPPPPVCQAGNSASFLSEKRSFEYSLVITRAEDESLSNLPALKGKGRDKKVEYLSLVFDLREAPKDFVAALKPVVHFAKKKDG